MRIIVLQYHHEVHMKEWRRYENNLEVFVLFWWLFIGVKFEFED